MSQTIKIISLLSFLFLSNIHLYSQDDYAPSVDKKLVIIKMKSGNEFVGRIIKKEDGKITLETLDGEIQLASKNVVSIKPFNGRLSDYSNQGMAYFISNSAISLKKGTGGYTNLMLTTSLFNYGVTDNFSIGGGFELLSTIAQQPIWFLTPKYSFKLEENKQIGTGVVVIGFGKTSPVQLVFANITLGTPESNITGGIAFGYFQGDLLEIPALTAAGVKRLSKRFSLMSENYFVLDPNSTAYLYVGIHGFRIHWDDSAISLGGVIFQEISPNLFALPFLGYTAQF